MDLRRAFKPAVSALRSLLGLNGVASEIHAVYWELCGLEKKLEQFQSEMRRHNERVKKVATPEENQTYDAEPSFATLHTASGKIYRLSLDHAARRDGYQQAIAAGSYDISLQFLNDWIRPGDVFFDLGANIGTISIPAAVNGATVHAFELLDANIQHLRRSVRENSLRNIFLVMGAVSNRQEFLGVGGVSAWGMVQDGALVNIPSVMIDSYARQKRVTAINVMKIDVEGSELKALGGAAFVLERDHPDIVIECNAFACGNYGYSYKDILGFLEARGYSIYRLLDGRRICKCSADLPQEVFCVDYLATTKSLDVVLDRSRWSFDERTIDDVIKTIVAQQHYSFIHPHYLLAIEPTLPPPLRGNAVISQMIERAKVSEDMNLTATLRTGSV